MADGPEARVSNLPSKPRGTEIDFQAVVIPGDQGDETLVRAGKIPDTDSTLIFSLPFDQSGDRPSVHVGVFAGTVPDKSAPNWEDFARSARRIAQSGQVVSVEAFAGRVDQIVRDEQMYARANPKR
jgi:hypothetical protein